jgi:hypothetical protein
MRRFLMVLLVLVVLPILVGGVVLLVAGRPVAFEVLQWRIERRFPDVNWLKPDELARRRSDPA